MQLIVLNYNNYYNRILKWETDLTDYLSYSIHSTPKANFNPSDGVETSHDIGSNVNPYSGAGDYLLVVNDYMEIESRWFIMDNIRVRNGQWRAVLRRDLVADYINEILDADTFIEKANVPFYDPLIHNPENFTLNQIKTSETQLKDKTECPWIIGYYNRKDDSNGVLLEATYRSEIPFDFAIPATYESWEFRPYVDNTYAREALGWDYVVRAIELSSVDIPYRYVISKNSASRTYAPQESTGYTLNPRLDQVPPTAAAVQQAMVDNWGALSVDLFADAALPTEDAIKRFKSYNNKVLRFSDGAGGYEYRKIYVSTENLEEYHNHVVDGGALHEELRDTLDRLFYKNSSNAISNTYFGYTIVGYKYKHTSEIITSGTYSASITTATYHLNDAGYNMFAIPCPEEGKYFTFTEADQIEYRITRTIAMGIASAFATNYAEGGKLYDLQLLPYCPCPQIIKADGTFSTDGDNLLRTPIVDEDGDTISFILHPSFSSFTLDIYLDNPISIVNPKMETITDLYRLVSPNYNGTFEFSAAKNGGINYFNVDCTYKPYNPYIHINPNFQELYGQDFNDARGLILGGDFSLPIMGDKWETYQIQNKYYQEIFDRQIQTMELKNKFGLGTDIASAFTGTVGGSVAGAVAGSSIAPGYGTAAGAIIGGVASAGAGIADVAHGEVLRKDALDYTHDMFGFHNGTIQALPQSIIKTTAFTYNNKVFPILEFYTCTDREKSIVATKLAFNGMTVNALGKIKDYIENTWEYNDYWSNSNIVSKGYIKGKIVHINIPEDRHIINAIAEEIDKGVYTQWA